MCFCDPHCPTVRLYLLSLHLSVLPLPMLLHVVITGNERWCFCDPICPSLRLYICHYVFTLAKNVTLVKLVKDIIS